MDEEVSVFRAHNNNNYDRVPIQVAGSGLEKFGDKGPMVHNLK